MAKDLMGGNNPLKKGIEDMAKNFGKGKKNPLEMLCQK